MNKRLWVFLLALFVPSTGLAVDITVCPGGGCDETDLSTAIGNAGAGDTIILQADTVGGSVTFTDDSFGASTNGLTIKGRAGDTVVWEEDGFTYLIQANTVNATGWTIGPDLILDMNDTVDGMIVDVNNSGGTFSNLLITGCTIRDTQLITDLPAASLASLTIRNCVIESPTTGGTEWIADIRADIALLVENCTFDGSDVGANSWNHGFYLDSMDDPTQDKIIRNNYFSIPDGDGGSYITLRSTSGGATGVVNLLIEGNTFENAHLAAIRFQAGTADRFLQDVTVLNNTITNLPTNAGGIDFELVAAGQAEPTAIDYFHRDISIIGNTIKGTGANTQPGIALGQCRRGIVTHNDVRDMGGASGAGVVIRSTRHTIVGFNRFYGCENGILVHSNSTGNWHQYGCRLVWNYFGTGTGADGAINVDNWDGAATSEQDSMLYIDWNVFDIDTGSDPIIRWYDDSGTIRDASSIAAAETVYRTYGDDMAGGYEVHGTASASGVDFLRLKQFGTLPSSGQTMGTFRR